jgi:hypothetical protein
MDANASTRSHLPFGRVNLTSWRTAESGDYGFFRKIPFGSSGFRVRLLIQLSLNSHFGGCGFGDLTLTSDSDGLCKT